jgi:hypothetical protein
MITSVSERREIMFSDSFSLIYEILCYNDAYIHFCIFSLFNILGISGVEENIVLVAQVSTDNISIIENREIIIF